MRILYVTGMFSGLKDLILTKKKEASGMPAFLEPLKKMINEGYQVDLIIGTKDYKSKLYKEHTYLSNSQITLVPWNTSKSSILNICKAYKKINEIVKEGNYDFIYSHGSFGSIGNFVANRQGVKVGHRIYGTFLYKKIHQNNLKIFLNHPLEYLAFTMRKDFLLITNDGTKGNIVFNKINYRRKKRAPDCFFWLNGVNQQKVDEEKATCKKRILLYPARIASWKQQHLAIDLVSRMKDEGYTDIKLIFVGHISDEKYYKELRKKIKENKLTDQVYYRGTVSRSELYSLYKSSLAVLSFYELSNLGNVVIEALLNGAIVVSHNDGSLDNIVEDGENGYLIDNLDEGVNRLINIINNPKLSSIIKKNAKESAERIFSTWDQRSNKEINLIKKVCEKSHNK